MTTTWLLALTISGPVDAEEEAVANEAVANEDAKRMASAIEAGFLARVLCGMH
jgi:hypothetical protein